MPFFTNEEILISKNAIVHKNVKIGQGSIIMSGVIINCYSIILIVSKIWLFNMSKFGTIKETFQIYLYKRKFHMFPIVVLLIALIGVTALAQSGLVAFIYPI